MFKFPIVLIYKLSINMKICCSPVFLLSMKRTQLDHKILASTRGCLKFSPSLSWPLFIYNQSVTNKSPPNSRPLRRLIESKKVKEKKEKIHLCISGPTVMHIFSHSNYLHRMYKYYMIYQICLIELQSKVEGWVCPRVSKSETGKGHVVDPSRTTNFGRRKSYREPVR